MTWGQAPWSDVAAHERERAEKAEAERDALKAEVERLSACDDAVGEIHRICSDAGIPVGHVVARVQAMAADLDALQASLAAVAAECERFERPGLRQPCKYCARANAAAIRRALEGK